jgi:inosine-uridine nucleoside N-ribohydrolase
MAPKNRIIIDTDPGVDDVLALLLALSASPEELEVAMISVSYGNVPLHKCAWNYPPGTVAADC